MSFPLGWQRKHRFVVMIYFAVSSQPGRSLQTVSCKRFRVGRLFKCYKALWKYRVTSLCIQLCHKFTSSFALKLQRNCILSWGAQLKMPMGGSTSPSHSKLPFQKQEFLHCCSKWVVPGPLAECTWAGGYPWIWETASQSGGTGRQKVHLRSLQGIWIWDAAIRWERTQFKHKLKFSDIIYHVDISASVKGGGNYRNTLPV